MNPKIDKLARDIEKTEKKIADLQKKLELFKEEKTRLENEDYGDIGRDFQLLLYGKPRKTVDLALALCQTLVHEMEKSPQAECAKRPQS